MVLLFLISIGIDVLWFFVIYVRVLNNDDYDRLARWETGIHTTVLVVGIANIVLKIIAIALSIFFEPEVRVQYLGTPATVYGVQLR